MATEETTLRDELKAWENQFKAEHGGRKPSREDIKSNASIAAKYKQFKLVRCPPVPDKQPIETPKKASRNRDVSSDALRERAPNAAVTTPRKKEHKIVEAVHPPILSPVQEEQPTPAFIRSALGPTPQRDGQVLGIFDELPNGTPSRRSPSPTGERGSDAVQATPSKSASRDSALSRTPQSSSKRHYMDAFITTPGKRKREDDEVGTPSTSKKLFATPSFLRRISHPMAPIGEEEDDSAAALMLPPRRSKKPFARSFSEIIKDLRNQEEERMDDEWDIMNELEAEDQGNVPAAKKIDQVQVEDSQGVEMPLGPDQAPEESDSEEEGAALGANGLPRKVYKKKGQKRTTRRANLKPVLHQPRKAADLEPRRDESEDEGDGVAETQVDGEGRSTADGSAPGQETAGNKIDKSGNPVKRVAQKVSQNFRRLKVNGPKGKGRGRFGRR
ncbi:hypothetical protein Q7P37_006386 [Cladosporium fusiforme]